MLKRLLASSLAASMLFLVSAPAAFGASAIDQSQIQPDHAAIVWGASVPTAQTFTPAHSGRLDRVSIYAAAYGAGSGVSNNQTLSIQATASGLPTGSSYATKNIVVADGWNDITLDSPVSVQAGVTYAIVIVPAQQYDPYYTCDGSLYTRGQALVQDTSWKTVPQYATDHGQSTTTYCAADFTFRAYVNPDDVAFNFTVNPTSVPHPSTTGPITFTLTATNNGALATSNHVMISSVSEHIPLVAVPGTWDCSPAVCNMGAGLLDMGVIPAGGTVTWTGTGSYDVTGVAAGTTYTDEMELCIANGIVVGPTVVGPVLPHGAGVLQASGCWNATVQLAVGAAATTPSPTVRVTLPPTNSSHRDGSGSQGIALALLFSCLALSAMLTIALARRRI